jgi:hypothetical protein
MLPSEAAIQMFDDEGGVDVAGAVAMILKR